MRHMASARGPRSDALTPRWARPADLYRRLNTEEVRYVGSIVAEAAKVIENVQRDLNIALVNGFARILPARRDVEDAEGGCDWRNFH